MFKKLGLLTTVIFTMGIGLSAPAYAVAAQSDIGYISTSCGNAQPPCFIQYGATVPVSGTGTGGNVVVDQGTSPWVTSDTTTQGNIGATNSTAAANPAATAGLNGVLKGFWTDVKSFFVTQGSTTSGQSGPLSQCAVTTSSPTYTTAQTDPESCNTHGAKRSIANDAAGNDIDLTKNNSFWPYPAGATAKSCTSGNVAAATATCTFPEDTGKFTFVTGFDITGSGATAGAVVTCTLTNTGSVTQNYTFVATAGALLADTPLVSRFTPPLQATAVSTSPVLSCPSLGTGATNMTINGYGYTLLQ